MKRLPMMFPVHPEAAARWLLGDPDVEPDLLDAMVDQSPVIYMARMNGPADWWCMLQLLELWQPKCLIFRTRLPGLLKLLQRCSGQVAWTEPDGSSRCVADRYALATLLRRLRWLAQRKDESWEVRQKAAALTVA